MQSKWVVTYINLIMDFYDYQLGHYFAVPLIHSDSHHTKDIELRSKSFSY
jgi:hypothetical protein